MLPLPYAQLTPQLLLRASIAVAVLTIAMKSLAWWVTGSMGLLSDAMESLVNLASAAFGLLMVTIAHRPPDSDHPFGHTKAEYFSSGFEGLMILLAAGGILWAATGRLLAPAPLTQLGWGLALSVGSSVLNGLLAWTMLEAGRFHRSIALEGDARHLFTDVWTSAGVVLGLALVAVTGWLWLDAVVAIAVALNIAFEGGRLLWKSSQGLMDEAVESEVLSEIDGILARFRSPDIRFDHVSSRRAGRRRFVELHMHVPGAWTLGRASARRAEVERALVQGIADLRPTIQLLPGNAEPDIDGKEDPV